LKFVIEKGSPAVSPISFATVVVTSSVSLVRSLVEVLEVSSVVVQINTPYALSATKAKTSSHLSMLTFPDPYLTCGVEADPDVVVETVLRTVGRTVVV
jgi:hypothetical protein